MQLERKQKCYLAERTELARISAKLQLHFLMAIVYLEYPWELWPRVVFSPLSWWFWKDLKCGDGLGPLKHRIVSITWLRMQEQHFVCGIINSVG
jgi:hypothetical protein